MPVESCTQALSDVALSFGEDDEQEESRMVISVWYTIMHVLISGHRPMAGWLLCCIEQAQMSDSSVASCSEILAAVKLQQALSTWTSTSGTG